VTSRLGPRLGLPLVAALLALAPVTGAAHPMGNFSISRYAALSVDGEAVRVRYVVDMAEIPTFQEIQRTGLVPEVGDPGLARYLDRTVETLGQGLTLEVDGRRLPLRAESRDGLFPPGAGGLPTLRIGIVYRAALDGGPAGGLRVLTYRDDNFADRSGWKEIVARAGAGVTVLDRSVSDQDRSRELTDYPADPLASPPQELSARLVFTRTVLPVAASRSEPAPPAPGDTGDRGARPSGGAAAIRARPPSVRPDPPAPSAPAVTEDRPIPVDPRAATRPRTPRPAFSELITTRELRPAAILVAMLIAATLGAFHAIEPGHGKTVVAAYLVGSRGTARHALVLGLVVTASHTAGVYLLGAVALYASRYVVPERLYPWLGVASGLTIAALGCVLLLRRWAAAAHPHGHDHGAHGSGDDGAHPHDHAHGHPHSHSHSHSHGHAEPVSLRALLALGITGGMVPCPAALVVLLSAVALRRVGFGLLLIVAFSAGLAAVLVGIGLLMVYARRFMSRFHGDGPLITRWLPLTSAAVITLSGVVIALQALGSAGILHLRL
jgi:ABC-type nickel/cobalt efflux system permease component RcnA